VSNYEHLESANQALPSLFKNFTYSDYFEDKGTGFTFKIGAIYKPVETVRIGFAFHTPTWYHIDEYFTQNITSNFTDGGHYDYSVEPLRFEYALATPYRLLGGVAVQIGKMAFLSADYEFVDYSQAHFSQTGDGYNYSEKNSNIKNSLKSASNIRAGGELRITKLYFRGGYGYYGKAFNPGEDNADLDYTSFTGGIGFREQNISVDFGYTNLRYSQKYVLYPLPDNFDPAIANLSTAKNMFTLTFGYKFGY
jgi:long-subunit fatty acid transport protein